jgi:hypothetical protein
VKDAAGERAEQIQVAVGDAERRHPLTLQIFHAME